MSKKFFTGSAAKKYFRVVYITFIFIFVGFTVTFFFASPSANAEKPSKSADTSEKNNPVPTPQVPAQIPASSVNPVTQAAVNAGVLSCISRINQVIAYLVGNSQSGAFLFLPQRLPDQSIFSTSIEVQGQNAIPIYASASFAPLTSGQAGAVYDAVQYLPQSLDSVEKNIFKGLKRIGVLKKDIVILDGGAVKIFLMPAGSGCIVIKKEVVQ